MPVYSSPPATFDPNEDAVLVGYWLGGLDEFRVGPSLRAVTPAAARAALARLRKTDFAGVHPILVGALTRLLANPPRRQRGRPANPLRRAAIAQFIRDRVTIDQPWGKRPRYTGTDAAIEAAMQAFDIGRDYAFEIWQADRDATRLAAPITGAVVPIGSPTSRKRRRP